MPRKLEAYIEEITKSIDEIGSFVNGMNFEQYSSDPKTKAAVERKLLNIGEALNQASELNDEFGSQITDFQKIIGFRNVLAHGYFGIDDALVWNVITTKLDLLKNDVVFASDKRRT